MAKKKTTEEAVPAENGTSEIRFERSQVLRMRKYQDKKDMLSVLLQEGQSYTHDEIESLTDEFLKGKVNQ